jgi:hypothetical protein
VDAGKYPLKVYFENEALPEEFPIVLKRAD